MLYQSFFEEIFDDNGVLQDAKLTYQPQFNFAYDVFDVLAQTYPHKLAMLWKNEAKEELRLSFADIAQRTNQTANALQKLGVQKGDMVMVSLKTRYEYWYIALACHKLGAILVPIFHLLSRNDVEYRIKKAKPRVAICTCDGETTKHIKELASSYGVSHLFTVDGAVDGFAQFAAAIQIEDTSFERIETSADEPILLYFTSGTTGTAKGVLHDHAFTLGTYLGARYMQNIGSDSLHFATGNTAWEVVCGTKFYGQWLCEAAIFVYDYDRFHADTVLYELSEAKVTSMMAQPTVYRQLVAEGMQKYDLGSIQTFAVGGEKLTRQLADQVYEQTGKVLYEGYAQSEAGLIAANSENVGRKEGSVGKILPKYEVEIRTDDGKVAKPFESGEIVLRGKHGQKAVGLLMGYYEETGINPVIWDGDIFRTKDMGYLDEDGFLFYLGRMDGMIKRKGYRVSAFEIEERLSQHHALYECVVVGKPDEEIGQSIHAYVVLKDGIPQESKEEILQFHNQYCSPFQKIKEIHIVDALKRNQNGKVIRNYYESL